MKTLKPLQPTMPPYPSEVAAVTFTTTQQLKIADLVSNVSARARRPYLRFIELAKRALAFGDRDRVLSHKLAALLTMND